MEEPEDILFTEITEPEAAGHAGAVAYGHPSRGVPRGGVRGLPARCRLGTRLSWPATRTPARSATAPPGSPTIHTHDAWICPEEQLLVRSEVDHERRLVRYRGRPQICNHCPAKSDCTDSDEGREVVRAMDPWPHSEAGRFHRGISLAVALIAGLILAAEALRNHAPLELAVLGAVFTGRRADGLAPARSLPRHPGQLPGSASRPIV